jgi:hypothetical protein
MDIANTCFANQSPTHTDTHRLIGCFAIQASEEPEKIQGDDDHNRHTLLSQLLTPHTHKLHKSLVKILSGLPKTILKKAALEHQ